MNKEEKKTCFVSFEITKKLRAEIDRLAERQSISRSEYIRNALFEYMNK